MPEGTQESGGGAGALLGGLLKNPELQQAIQQTIVSALLGWIRGLFSKKPKPPQIPVVVPTPAPNQPDPRFPDDHIPRPNTGRKVAKVKVKLERVQLPRERFPDSYTEENPFGLVDPKPIQSGQTAVNWGSKGWVDVTAYDEAGKEFLRADVLAFGLAYKTRIAFGDTFIEGKGADAAGQPVAGYVTNDTSEVGQGRSAWLSSLGFLQQFQVFAGADGKTFQVTASVDGVEAENPFTVRVG